MSCSHHSSCVVENKTRERGADTNELQRDSDQMNGGIRKGTCCESFTKSNMKNEIFELDRSGPGLMLANRALVETELQQRGKSC